MYIMVNVLQCNPMQVYQALLSSIRVFGIADMPLNLNVLCLEAVLPSPSVFVYVATGLI